MKHLKKFGKVFGLSEAKTATVSCQSHFASRSINNLSMLFYHYSWY